ncbi:hypothetical protein EC957_005840, partial [Mortierella hygrophila]
EKLAAETSLEGQGNVKDAAEEEDADGDEDEEEDEEEEEEEEPLTRRKRMNNVITRPSQSPGSNRMVKPWVPIPRVTGSKSAAPVSARQPITE